ncbi:MAG: undecaprenyl-diphosphatase [Planctomycetota bacterium]
MDSLHIVWLALVQGLSEFLPVSSSAHLVLLPRVMGWVDQGLVFDVAVHLGSLIAVVGYFHREVWRMLTCWLRSISGGGSSRDSQLAWWVILGTLPAVIVGLAFKGFIESDLRSPWVIAITTIVFGLLLGFADYQSKRERSEYQLRLKDVLLIGCFQALALIPGTSRSGITITMGLLLGLTRQAASRFSFLLAIPIIIASGSLQMLDLIKSPDAIDWQGLSLAVLLSALSAGLCIHFFLKLIDRVGMIPFVVYRLLLGMFIIAVLV